MLCLHFISFTVVVFFVSSFIFVVVLPISSLLFFLHSFSCVSFSVSVRRFFSLELHVYQTFMSELINRIKWKPVSNKIKHNLA